MNPEKDDLTIIGKIWYCFLNLKPVEKILFFVDIFVVISILIFQFTGSNLDFNSDTATANLLAEEMTRTGSWFPNTWNAGQDLWVFGLQSIIALLTLFMDDYILMHSIAAMVFILLSVIICIFFSTKVLKNNTWLVVIPFLFCGLTTEYSHVVFGQCAYITQLISIFLILGLYIKCTDENQKIKSKPLFIVTMLLIVFFCFSGIRCLQTICIPLLGAIIVSYFFKTYKNKNYRIGKDVIPYISKILFIGAASIIGLIGFLYFSSLLNNFSAGGSALSIDSSYDNISSRIIGFIKRIIMLFGVDYSGNLFSINGILMVIRFVCGTLFLVVVPILQLRKFKEESSEVQFFIIFSVIHILEIIILELLTGIMPTDTSRYLFTTEFLLLFMSAHYVYKHWIQDTGLVARICILAAVSAFTLPQSIGHFFSFSGYSEAMNSMKSLVSFLEQNDLTYGYATYWNAGSNTVLSNGKVEINSISLGDKISPYYWLNSSYRYTEEYHDGPSFLLLSEEENQSFINISSYSALGEPSDVYTFNDMFIYSYDYNISHNDFSGIIDNWDSKEMMDSLVSSSGNANSEDGYTLDPGERWYGPYWDISADKYTISLTDNNENATIHYILTANSGQDILQEGEIIGSKYVIEFDLSSDISQFELVMDNLSDQKVEFEKITLQKVS